MYTPLAASITMSIGVCVFLTFVIMVVSFILGVAWAASKKEEKIKRINAKVLRLDEYEVAIGGKELDVADIQSN